MEFHLLKVRVGKDEDGNVVLEFVPVLILTVPDDGGQPVIPPADDDKRLQGQHDWSSFGGSSTVLPHPARQHHLPLFGP